MLKFKEVIGETKFEGVQIDERGAWLYSCKSCVDKFQISKEFIGEDVTEEELLCHGIGCNNIANVVVHIAEDDLKEKKHIATKEKVSGDYIYKLHDAMLFTDATDIVIENAIKLVKSAKEDSYTIEDLEEVLSSLGIRFSIAYDDMIINTSW